MALSITGGTSPRTITGNVTSNTGIAIDQTLGTVSSSSMTLLDDSGFKNGFGYEFAANAMLNGRPLVNTLRFSLVNNVLKLSGRVNVRMVTINTGYDSNMSANELSNEMVSYLDFSINVMNQEGECLTIPIIFNITAPGTDVPVNNLADRSSRFLYLHGLFSNIQTYNTKLVAFYRHSTSVIRSRDITYAQGSNVYDAIPPYVFDPGDEVIIPLPNAYMQFRGFKSKYPDVTPKINYSLVADPNNPNFDSGGLPAGLSLRTMTTDIMEGCHFIYGTPTTPHGTPFRFKWRAELANDAEQFEEIDFNIQVTGTPPRPVSPPPPPPPPPAAIPPWIPPDFSNIPGYWPPGLPYRPPQIRTPGGVNNPSTLTVPSRNTSGFYRVSWLENPEAQSYELFESVGNGSFTSIAKTSAISVPILKELPDTPTVYQYQVRGTRYDGSNTANSVPGSVTVQKDSAEEGPTVTAVGNYDGRTRFTISDKGEGAHYNIREDSSPSGAPKIIYSGNSLIVDVNTTSGTAVRAQSDINGVSSAYGPATDFISVSVGRYLPSGDTLRASSSTGFAGIRINPDGTCYALNDSSNIHYWITTSNPNEPGFSPPPSNAGQGWTITVVATETIAEGIGFSTGLFDTALPLSMGYSFSVSKNTPSARYSGTFVLTFSRPGQIVMRNFRVRIL